MSINATRPAWWRFPSPSLLVLVLLLSFLPWIEFGCESKVNTSSPFGDLGGFGGGKGVTAPKVSGGRTILATQSGFQIATGGHTVNSPIEGMQEGKAKNSVGSGAKGQPPRDKDGFASAPLMFVFFLAVLTGIVTGFAMPPGRVRLLVVGASVSAAILLLLIQSVVLRFPAAKDADEMNADAAHTNQAAPGQITLGGQDVGKFFVRYTPWYWLTWLAVIGALVPLGLEEMLAPKKRRPGEYPADVYDARIASPAPRPAEGADQIRELPRN